MLLLRTVWFLPQQAVHCRCVLHAIYRTTTTAAYSTIFSRQWQDFAVGLHYLFDRGNQRLELRYNIVSAHLDLPDSVEGKRPAGKTQRSRIPTAHRADAYFAFAALRESMPALPSPPSCMGASTRREACLVGDVSTEVGFGTRNTNPLPIVRQVATEVAKVIVGSIVLLPLLLPPVLAAARSTTRYLCTYKSAMAVVTKYLPSSLCWIPRKD